MLWRIACTSFVPCFVLHLVLFCDHIVLGQFGFVWFGFILFFYFIFFPALFFSAFFVSSLQCLFLGL
eukprot:m.264307 g.264307  ORF g.264307 m.264307 type:complete len:67 (-) comp15611_c0_seq2:2304-2504(-)